MNKNTNRSYNMDIILMIDTNWKILYYNAINDSLIQASNDSPIGKHILDLYPYFKKEDETTLYRSMKSKSPILNEFQTVTLGENDYLNVVNSAFPLINETGLIGCVLISKELNANTELNALSAQFKFSDIITANKAFIEQLEKLKQLSSNDSTVLITGETGTGKELIAHSIHNESNRKHKPFVVQNCAAIPENLMESIMFGTIKGSFTGAIEKPGLLESADGGTIFLDEINSMPLTLQSKLLRAIEYQQIKRVGSSTNIQLNVRFIASTNVDLLKEVKAGHFREDLYYRLSIINFIVPPLSERIEDITLLSNTFIQKFNQLFSKNIAGLSNDVLKLFFDHSWKGNIRELKNTIEYAMNYSTDGFIQLQDLPDNFTSQDSHSMLSVSLPPQKTLSKPTNHSNYLSDASLVERLEAFEKDIIEETLINCRYNIQKTADALKIPRQTLYYKLKKLSIDYK